jgi:hypothetical protein
MDLLLSLFDEIFMLISSDVEIAVVDLDLRGELFEVFIGGLEM